MVGYVRFQTEGTDMSLDATIWAFKQPIPDPAAKLVLVALSDQTGDEHGNIEGTLDEVLEALVETTSMTIEHVRWAYTALYFHGYIGNEFWDAGLLLRPLKMDR